MARTRRTGRAGTQRGGLEAAGEQPSNDQVEPTHRVRCHLDELLEDRQLTLKELAERVGVTVVNLSVLKNDRAKAIRFSTLTAICDVLGCQPGDLFSVEPVDDSPTA